MLCKPSDNAGTLFVIVGGGWGMAKTTKSVPL